MGKRRSQRIMGGGRKAGSRDGGIHIAANTSARVRRVGGFILIAMAGDHQVAPAKAGEGQQQRDGKPFHSSINSTGYAHVNARVAFGHQKTMRRWSNFC